jgi:hypothetical protein
MADETEFAALERNLRNATEQFKLAEQRESYARKERCDAQNALNAAQRQIDAYLEKLRLSAPPDSDWKRSKIKREAA